MAGINSTAGVRDFNGPSRESGTETIVSAHTNENFAWGRADEARARNVADGTPSADLMFYQSQFNLSTEYAVYDGIVGVTFSVENELLIIVLAG